MPGDKYIAENRFLYVNTPLGADKLLLLTFAGSESVSELFRFQLDLCAKKEDEVKFDELIGKAVFAALADAGLKLDAVDGFAFFAYGFDPGTITEQLGIKRLTFSHIVSGYGGGMDRKAWLLAHEGAETPRLL